MTTYNNVTENCFKDCIKDFTSRKILKQEVHCILVCTVTLSPWVRHPANPYIVLQDQVPVRELTIFGFHFAACMFSVIKRIKEVFILNATIQLAAKYYS